MTTGHVVVNGVAGYADVHIHAQVGAYCIPVAGVRIGPEQVRALVRDLLSIASDELTAPPLCLVRKAGDLWGFVCHDHDGPPVRGTFHHHAAALAAADKHTQTHQTRQEAHRG